MSSGRLRHRSSRRDPFWKRAKTEGYAARSVFKLEQMDERYHLLAPGQRVLDLGCRPGSWLEYAAKKIGPEGRLVGLDRAPLAIQIKGARLLTGDVLSVSPDLLRGDLEAFDVVLSDLAPDTSGVRSLDQARSEALYERALDLALGLLSPGGHFVGKLFQGPDFARLRRKTQAQFDRVAIEKPEASRKQSMEIYLVGIGRKATPGPAAP